MSQCSGSHIVLGLLNRTLLGLGYAKIVGDAALEFNMSWVWFARMVSL